MSNKLFWLLLAISVAVLGADAVAQHIPPSPSPSPSPNTSAPVKAGVAASVSPVGTVASAPAATPAPNGGGVALTIAELAANQAKVLAAKAPEKVGFGVTAPSAGMGASQSFGPAVPEIQQAPIGIVSSSDKKARIAPVPAVAAKPYLASIIGMKGREIAEIHAADGGHIVATGDIFQNWIVEKIVDGRLYLYLTTQVKTSKKKPAVKSKVLKVGDYL